MRDKHGCGNSNTNHDEMLETKKETQIEYEINFYFKKGIQLLSFQAEDGIRDVERSRGLGDVYKRQV